MTIEIIEVGNYWKMDRKETEEISADSHALASYLETVMKIFQRKYPGGEKNCGEEMMTSA